MRKCPRGVICTDKNTLWLAIVLAVCLMSGAWIWSRLATTNPVSQQSESSKPHVIVVQPQQQQQPSSVQLVRPDIYPEPVSRLGIGLPTGLFPAATRGPATPYQQVGILTAEGSGDSTRSGERTILPLYGRELDPRRGRWNYYTRTDGTNPVQVTVRIRNRVCDDDTNGCDELSDGDNVHVPAMGRAFQATVYRRSIFG
jgi:hypothetical protein